MTSVTILVVDDDASIRRYVASNLTARGYEVATAEDGTEALKLIGERPFDLMILDLSLPGPDGLEVLKAVRRDMEVPVVILSARRGESDKVDALDLGADDYLTKPFGVQELLARVHAALRRAGSGPKGPLPPYRREELEVDFGARNMTSWRTWRTTPARC